MSGYDHYAEAKGIAEQIEAEGFEQQASDVRKAISEGRSGTEIFMQLRFYLSSLQTDMRIDPITRDRIATLVSKLNEALSR